MVTYQTTCDPATESCFVSCDDEECTTESYYKIMEKYAPYIYEECGSDITDCEEGTQCLPKDHGRCTITYCDPEESDATCAVYDSEETQTSFIEQTITESNESVIGTSTSLELDIDNQTEL